MARAQRGQIGGALCLSDELSTGICRPTGRFCVIMPMKLTIPPVSMLLLQFSR